MKTIPWLIPLAAYLVLSVGCGSDSTGPEDRVDDEDWTFPEGGSALALTAYCEPDTVHVGDTFDVKVVLYNVRELLGASLEVAFDPSRVAVSAILPGPLVAADDALVVDLVEAALSRVSYAASLQRGQPEVQGSGVLLKLRCEARAAGTATFAPADPVDLRDADGGAVPHSAELIRNSDSVIIVP